MRALVTGGSGFIGSNIVNLLLDKAYEVTVMDNLTTGYLYNIKDYIDKKLVRFIQGDVRDANAVMQACEKQDVVFHLAASVGRQRSLNNPAMDSNINLIGTINILEGMRKHNIYRIVYSSSAAIFGEPHKHPLLQKIILRMQIHHME